MFDVGSDAGVSYVISELLEGETLRERLKAGAVPPRKTIEIAAQMARGLAAAHEKGIVHRDLKPENLFLTRDGRLKILDFGIAKLVGPESGEQTIAPTIEPGTTPGMVLGTVGYMSPEQVRGLSVDYRTDIFSFGAIVYEMLSGRRAFAGATQADTMSAILGADPPEVTDTARPVPAILDRLVRRCLEKDPEERFQSARDVAFNLDAISTAGFGTGGIAALDAPAVSARLPRAWVVVALALGLTVGAAVAWMAAMRTRPTLGAAAFQQVTFRRGTIRAARFSPDGDTVVYSSSWEGKPQELYSARIGAIGERALGIQGELLAISKSGEMALLLNARVLSNWMQTGTLARAPLGGGAPREILRDVGGAEWSPDGRQLAITRFLPAVRRWRLEYPAGTVIYETDMWIERPRFSRDGSTILLLEHPINGDDRGRVVVVTLKGEKTVLTPEYPSLVGAAWSPSGDEAWFTASVGGIRRELLAVRRGGAVRQVAPTPASLVVEDVRTDGRMLLQTIAMKSRMLVKTPADPDERDLSWFDFAILRDMSADGSTVLFDEEGEGGGANYSVFVRRTDGAPAVRIGDGGALRLSPDLQWALTQGPADPLNVFIIMPVGAGEPRRITVPLQSPVNPRWFPDGKRLAVVANEPGRPRRAYEYTIESGKLRPLTPEGTTGTLVSPDSRLLLAVTADGKRVLWPLEGGEPREVRGLLPRDQVTGWAAGGGSLLVSAPTSTNRRDLARLDVASGRRQVILTIGPADFAGVLGLGFPYLSADGRTYAYRYTQTFSDLFVGDGMK